MLLPQSIEAVNADWATQALAPRFPGTVVTNLTIGTAIRGTATKLRLLLDYNDAGHAHGLPPTMWFKGGLEAHSDVEHMMSVYAAEAAFYADIAPRLAMTLPRSYLAHIDTTTGQSAILFEDMLARNARFGYATNPASPTLAASVLSQLAVLHATFWKTDAFAGNPVLSNRGPQLAEFLAAFLYTRFNWDRCLALPRGKFLTGKLADLHYMHEAINRMLAFDRAHANTLVHGDAHLGNVCILPGEQASFLDWQTTMTGFWAHDVSYFLTAALTVADRRAHERDLIAHYTNALNAAGGQLDEATAWREYRRHALYTFCWFPCNPEWQPEEVAATNTERAVAAIQDLDTLACWES